MVNEQMKEEDANESAQLEIKYISEKIGLLEDPGGPNFRLESREGKHK